MDPCHLCLLKIFPRITMGSLVSHWVTKRQWDGFKGVCDRGSFIRRFLQVIENSNTNPVITVSTFKFKIMAKSSSLYRQTSNSMVKSRTRLSTASSLCNHIRHNYSSLRWSDTWCRTLGNSWSLWSRYHFHRRWSDFLLVLGFEYLFVVLFRCFMSF